MNVYILGGYGDVGIHAVRFLMQHSRYHIKVGGRNLEKVPQEIKSEFADAGVELVHADLCNPNSMESFLLGCDMLINCTGPGMKLVPLACQYALEKNFHYVDVSSAKDVPKVCSKEQTIALVSGALPGLNGIFQRYCANRTQHLKGMHCYTAWSEIFTHSAGDDYLNGFLDAKKGKCIDHQIILDASLKPILKEVIPNKGSEILNPQIDSEVKSVIRLGDIPNGDWYVTYGGKHTFEFLQNNILSFFTNKDECLKGLKSASQKDVDERGLYIGYLVQIIDEKHSITYRLIVDKSAKATGYTCASVALSILEGMQQPGVYASYELNNPDDIVERLIDSNLVKFSVTEEEF